MASVQGQCPGLASGYLLQMKQFHQAENYINTRSQAGKQISLVMGGGDYDNRPPGDGRTLCLCLVFSVCVSLSLSDLCLAVSEHLLVYMYLSCT